MTETPRTDRYSLRTATVRCPCCGYTTLHERACYEICVLCEWEDDGQDDLRADEVWGGPNHNLSLTEARRNFREHLNVFRRGEDPRIGGVESPEETRAKRAILEALDFLAQTPSATVV